MNQGDVASCASMPARRAAAYAAGLMEARQASAFERHLGQCAACREQVRRQNRLDAVAEKLPVYRGPESAPDSRHPVRRALLPTLAAAAVVVLLLAMPQRGPRAELLAAALAAEQLTSIGGGDLPSGTPPLGDWIDDVPWLGFVTCSERIVASVDGVYLCALDEDGPLGLAGVRAGEIIRSVDGRSINGTLALNTHLARRAVGGEFRVGIERPDGTRHEVRVATVPFALGENHPFDLEWSPALEEHVNTEDELSPANLFEGIDDPLATRLGVPGGVRVLRTLDPDEQKRSVLAGFPGLYGPEGLRGGHVIVAVDGDPVTTVAELFLALDEVDQRPFTMTVHSMGAEPSVLYFGSDHQRREPPRVDSVTGPEGRLPARIVTHAAAFVSNGEALSRVWPGFFSPGDPFMIVDDSARGTLLVHPDEAPPEFRPLDAESLPAVLTGITYYFNGPPEGLAPGTFQADYRMAGDTLPALPTKGSTPFNQRDFYLHEAFHGYQSMHFPPPGRRVRFGEHLVDSELLDEEFRATARRERTLLRDIVAATNREEAFDLLRRYLELRADRLQQRQSAEEVERDLERREGTAQWVGCAGAAVTTAESDPSWMSAPQCVDRELTRSLDDDYSNFPEADARYMRWRLYGTGAALTLLLERYGPQDWRSRIEAGVPLDRILRDAVSDNPGDTDRTRIDGERAGAGTTLKSMMNGKQHDLIGSGSGRDAV